MTQAKEVAKKESTAMAEFDPSMFEADAGQGMENMGVNKPVQVPMEQTFI